mgnify:CR=1 FL=1
MTMATSPRILLVDDEPDLLDLMELTLVRMGLETDRATGVAEARAKLAKTQYDLCLTDMRLGDGEGLEVVAAASTLAHPVPVAVITNGSMLWSRSVQESLMEADLLLPSLDAGDAVRFQQVNRPHPKIEFEPMVNGIAEFTRRFRKPVWLEVFLLEGITGVPEEVERIAAWTRKMTPAKIPLHTVSRPPCEDDARPVPPEYVWGEALAELDRRMPRLRLVNLETAVTTRDDVWPGKGIHYRMHPANIGCLTAARLDVCVLANNHVLDWGRDGLVETLQVLRAAGIRTAGADADDGQAAAPAVIELPGGRVLVFAAATASSGVPRDWRAARGRAGVHLLDSVDAGGAEPLARAIAAHRQPGDTVIVSLHWGGNWGLWELTRSGARCGGRRPRLALSTQACSSSPLPKRGCTTGCVG